MVDFLFMGSVNGFELLLLLLGVMIPGMLSIFLILKYEKGAAMPAWIIAVFMIPVFGWLSYLIKYFLIDKKRSF